MSPDEKRLDIAIATRELEIELFWKRSLFFWGFISTAFVGYAALRSIQSDLATLVACFGMVCSAAWTLLNRGSKYWQENWETKVERYELPVTGPMFASPEPVQSYKGRWLRARMYSVSKLVIALSDYVFGLWLVLVGWQLYGLLREFEQSAKDIGVAVFVGVSLVYVVALVRFGRTSSFPPPPIDEGEKSSS
jgi:hypothetical protein